MSKWIKFFGEDDQPQKVPDSKMPQLNEPVEAITESSMMPIEEVDQLIQELDKIQGSVQPTAAVPQQKPAAQPTATPLQQNPVAQASATPPQQKPVAQQTVAPPQQNAVNKPKGKARNNVAPPVFVPRIVEVNEKLTIILVENTKEVAKEKDKLEKIVKSLVTSGYVCVINYGSLVREGKAVEAKSFDSKNLLWETFIGDRACIFDAITTLESVVEENYKKSEMHKGKKIRINAIDIIGIGRCVDNCSITSSENACKSFGRIVKYRDITTKYFCLSEESFVDAAKIGFHSIGAFARNYM